MNLSAGHWHAGTGAAGFIDEVTEARRVVARVSRLLREAEVNVQVILDNSSKNQRQNLNYLIAAHQKSKGLHVSIHFNAATKATNNGLGTEVLYARKEMQPLASTISAAISKESGLLNRGAKSRTDLALLNALQKAIIIELCFVNSKEDVARYECHFAAICQAIASSLISYNLEGK
ncbi:N-acetylmuramoyl-L-alanine amidase [Bacillus ndiopicus]|uniref:N-acetylmuramoyl-L-alanine amidase n=1 Tax=Bacillus ndiopicus TaxID=1347368 RepID=UPI000694A161|nr:N-acetylmuramoyl-L-alanine amidase [Bacillus ndiopicus]